MIPPNTSRLSRAGRRFRVVYRIGGGIERKIFFETKPLAEAFREDFARLVLIRKAGWERMVYNREMDVRVKLS